MFFESRICSLSKVTEGCQTHHRINRIIHWRSPPVSFTCFTVIVNWHLLVEKDHVVEIWNDVGKGFESALVEKLNVVVVMRCKETKKHHLDEQVASMEILCSAVGWKIVVDGSNIQKDLA